jgi:hypothetical protein
LRQTDEAIGLATLDPDTQPIPTSLLRDRGVKPTEQTATPTGDAGLGPRNVASIASANCGEEMVPISCPLTITVAPLHQIVARAAEQCHGSK